MSNKLMRDIRAIFGKKIKQIRLKQGLSQEALADISGLHRTYISNIENGNRNVSIKNVEKLAKALNIKIKNLF